MKPHEIAALIYAETEKLVPSQALLNDLSEQLADLVGIEDAADLVRRAAIYTAEDTLAFLADRNAPENHIGYRAGLADAAATVQEA